MTIRINMRTFLEKLRHYSTLGQADRYRVIGTIVLAAGVVAGAAYWVMAPALPPSMEDLPGYARAESRQLRIMMGQSGIILDQLRSVLERPAAKAVLIAGGFALLAAYFFRVAWVFDSDSRESHPHDDTTR